MVHDVLLFLKNRLNADLRAQLVDPGTEEVVTFVSAVDKEAVSFSAGKVNVLLINLEEDNTLRTPDPYTQQSPNALRYRVQPDLRLNLYVMFVPYFHTAVTWYEDSLRYLSMVIQYFQRHRLFNRDNAPELSEPIDQLAIELITLPFSEQNEIWSAFRTPYLPSAVYKVKMIVFKDDEGVRIPEIQEANFRFSRTSP